MALATIDDVENRLRQSDKHLATDDTEYTDGLLDEASALVLGYLGCDPTIVDTTATPPTTTVPEPVVVVTSRMVARVLQQGAAGGAGTDSATGTTDTAGPFSHTRQFGAGTTSGSPWLAAADKVTLSPYRCDGKAFSVDTAPARGTVHSEVCSANDYANYPSWLAFCTCGADIAGEPIFGSLP